MKTGALDNEHGRAFIEILFLEYSVHTRIFFI